MLDNTPNQPSNSHRTYNTISQIKFKAETLKSSLCDYIDAYILV